MTRLLPSTIISTVLLICATPVFAATPTDALQAPSYRTQTENLPTSHLIAQTKPKKEKRKEKKEKEEELGEDDC